MLEIPEALRRGKTARETPDVVVAAGEWAVVAVLLR
jgi:hypothetical protein